MSPAISDHYAKKEPSPIRLGQIQLAERHKSGDPIKYINTAIGNVSLPMHPAMIERAHRLGASGSPFASGVDEYTATVGTQEAQDAFLNIISASDFSTDGLQALVTDGGSQAMELMIKGLCGKVNGVMRPLLLIDPAYTNYLSFAERLNIPTVAFSRTLRDDGTYSFPSFDEIREVIDRTRPAAMVVIPYDNPTGQFLNQEMMNAFGKLAVEKDLWLVSDEAYRELHYTGEKASSVWGITEKDVPGIKGRRVSIESASKVWNACGLRIGSLVTDDPGLHRASVAEYTANLCSNAIGQYIFGALKHLSKEELQQHFQRQRDHYKPLITQVRDELLERLPGIIVSSPDASIYSVVDVKNVAKKGFDAKKFLDFFSGKGKVSLDGEDYTLLVSPMDGFYSIPEQRELQGKTQMRIAYVPKPESIKHVPFLFSELIKAFEAQR